MYYITKEVIKMKEQIVTIRLSEKDLQMIEEINEYYIKMITKKYPLIPVPKQTKTQVIKAGIATLHNELCNKITG